MGMAIREGDVMIEVEIREKEGCDDVILLFWRWKRSWIKECNLFVEVGEGKEIDFF